MLSKMPTYSICNLMGANRCASEILVTRLRDFVLSHQDIEFPHRHHFYQIVLFTRGGGRHAIDFQAFDIQPNQVYYMAPSQVHSWDFDEETDGYVVNFNDSLFASIYQNQYFLREFPLFNQISGSPVNNLESGVALELEQTFAAMLEEYEHGENYKLDMLRGMLLTILVRLSRVAPEPFQAGISKHQINLIRQFESLIEQHFREKKLPKAYAEMLFISPNHLNALTNQMIGKSAGAMIRERIMLEAKRLLVNSDLMISQIAAILQFEDNAYFTRFFKKHLGTSPEAFRNTHINQKNGKLSTSVPRPGGRPVA